ncbi:hypothetical protein J437_LFUL016100, partial [Ladona fulva]
VNFKWTDRVRNEEVYRIIEEVQTIWSIIRKRRPRWVGHILSHNGFVRSARNRNKGKAPRGRPRDKYINQIKKDIGKKRYQDVVGLALEREERKTAVNQTTD